MPFPSSPAEWDAIEPNETDATLVAEWQRDCCSRRPDDASALAAAARLLERERCVEALAAVIALNEYRGMSIAHGERAARAEARRILGVTK